jgi:phage-related protein
LPVLREGFEEQVKIIFRMIIKENLKIRNLGIHQSLALTLELHGFKYVFNGRKCIRPNRATKIRNVKGIGR